MSIRHVFGPVLVLLLGAGAVEAQPRNGPVDAQQEWLRLMREKSARELDQKYQRPTPLPKETAEQTKQREEQKEQTTRSRWRGSWFSKGLGLIVLAVYGYFINEIWVLRIRTATKWLVGAVCALVLAPVLWGYIWLTGALADQLPIDFIESTICNIILFAFGVGVLIGVGMAGHSVLNSWVIPRLFGGTSVSSAAREVRVGAPCPNCFARYQYDGRVCGNCGHNSDPPPAPTCPTRHTF